MDDNEDILGTDNPSFGRGAAKAAGKFVGKVIKDIAVVDEATNTLPNDDNDDDGFFSNVIDFGIGLAKGLNPFSSDND